MFSFNSVKLNGRLFVLAFAPLLLIHSLASACRADIILSDRLSSYQLTFSDPSFAGANAHYQVDILGTGNAGDTRVLSGINIKSSAQNLVFFGSGGLSVTNPVVVGTLGTVDLASNGTSGGFHFAYDTPPATDFLNTGTFGNTWIRRFTDAAGNIALEFLGGGSGLIDTGSFEVKVAINGDWSTLGTGPNQTQFIGINSLWTINSLFQFDPINNVTVFDASINPYLDPTNGARRDANLDFVLHSDIPTPPVPEPASLVLFGLGGMALVGARACKRKLVKK
jgi:hypothetical protein